MSSNRKFYRTVIEYEVLSEDAPVPDGMSLADIEYETTEGDWSGRMLKITTETVDAPTVAKLLQEQGTVAEFFRLDDAGNDLKEDEYGTSL